MLLLVSAGLVIGAALLLFVRYTTGTGGVGLIVLAMVLAVMAIGIERRAGRRASGPTDGQPGRRHPTA